MIDTPRTDALHHRTCAFGDGYRMSVLTGMCRDLERELQAEGDKLAAVTAERDALREAAVEMCGVIEEYTSLQYGDSGDPVGADHDAYSRRLDAAKGGAR